MTTLIFKTAALLMASSTAAAMNLDWSGTYRFEWVQVDKPSLATPTDQKAYGLHYLSLSPKIIASDGINIVSKFDVLANEELAYVDSQMGQLWGQSLPSKNPMNPADTDSSRSNALSRTKGATLLRVRQLYLNVNQEYGSLLVGRAPLQFGLGMTYNAGNGAFDHWTNSQDVVAYKFIIGNFFFMPMIARVADDGPAQSNAIQDETIQLQYENQDTGSMIGILHTKRKGTAFSNDIPLAGALAGGTRADGFTFQSTNFTLSRIWEQFQFRMEAGFMSGDYGIRNSAGNFVRNSSYGFAMEFDFPRPESKWDGGVRLGMASGDDPTTTDIEGYYFDRNYDVAFLLFNHRLGGRDFLQTNMIKDTGRGLSNSLDDETISNATYLSPRLRYKWNERWDVANTLTFAQLMVNPTNSLDFKKDLGIEWDIEVVYKPRETVRWINQLGVLVPGAAFRDGATGLTNGTVFGLTTKAAITF